MTAVPAELDIDAGAAAPGRLASAAARLRGRVGALPAGRLLYYAGAVLVPLGIVMIILGWYGTAHTTRLYEQIPYAVSGGFLGLGLVFFGAFAYFAYWVTRLIDDSRVQAAAAMEQSAANTAVLERIEELLREGAGPAGVGGSLVATATGSLAHRPDCPMVAGREGLRAVDPVTEKLKPCRICQPDL